MDIILLLYRIRWNPRNAGLTHRLFDFRGDNEFVSARYVLTLSWLSSVEHLIEQNEIYILRCYSGNFCWL